MSKNSATPRACEWHVDDLHYAGLSWGPATGTPVLALHGWMDHAESFSELAPRLKGCHVIALDLSGQGLTTNRARHATYNIWDDLPQITGILDQLGWKDCVVLGHSRGANIGALFAAAQPDRVSAFVALDALAPEPTETDMVNTLRAFIEDTRKQNQKLSRVFASREDYIRRRGSQGNARAIAEKLSKRALAEHPKGMRLRGDARLFASSAVKLKKEDVETVLKAIRCPILNIWASQGIKAKRPALAELVRFAETNISHYEQQVVKGEHHFHLDSAAADEIAEKILEFLAKNAAETPR